MLKTWQKLKKNPKLWNRYLLREKITGATRQFFTAKKFHEIETPVLAPALPAESYLEIFETKLLDRNRRAKNAYLTTSPEVFLKKLLVAGAGSCFTITKSFRNMETGSSYHNPEFSILEWYRVNSDYRDVMGDTEKLVLNVYKSLKLPGLLSQKPTIKYQGQTVDLSFPWEYISMTEAFSKYADLDLTKNLTLYEIRKTAKNKGYNFNKQTTWEELFNQIYLNEVVPCFNKNKPVVIYDFPSQLAALAKIKSADTRFCERFEVYIGGLELADGCTELTDPEEQRKRFEHQLGETRRLGKTQISYDREFISALEMKLPNCAGVAMGIDRLLMLFSDASKIQDVLLFPASELWEEKS